MLLLLALHGKPLEIKGEAVAVEEKGQDTWGRSYSLLLGKTIQKCGSALPPWESASSTTLTRSCRTQDFCQISLVELGKFLKSTRISGTPSPCQSSSAPPCNSWDRESVMPNAWSWKQAKRSLILPPNVSGIAGEGARLQAPALVLLLLLLPFGQRWALSPTPWMNLTEPQDQPVPLSQVYPCFPRPLVPCVDTLRCSLYNQTAGTCFTVSCISLISDEILDSATHSTSPSKKKKK